MKFNIQPAMKDFYGPVRVGDVFPAKGGARVRIAMWVVLAVNETGGTVLIGLNDKGEVSSATTYASHVMEQRVLIGRVEGLEDMEFNVEPLP